MTHGYPESADYCGFDKPSIEPLTSEEGEEVFFDIPDHDLRRKMTGRDPLSELLQFEVHLYVIIPKLFGYRFCPDCPHCIERGNPCTDIYGSNATPMCGTLGRVDAVIGAIENQKVEWVPHMHCFLYAQMQHQQMTLHEIAERLRLGLTQMSDMKDYINTARRVAYPDIERFQKERE